jgi:hypothetical protein
MNIAAGTTSASAVLWVYHDTGYSGYTDEIQIQTSPDGTTWTNRGAPIIRYDGTTGWAQHTIDLAALIGAGNFRIGYLGVSNYGNDTHMDDVAVNILTAVSCTTASSGPPRVPYSITATKITTGNHGTDGTVVFDKTNCASSNYHIIYGKGENLAAWTIDGGKCTLGTSGSYSWTTIPDPSTYTKRFLWFLVVGDNGSSTEGSWGLTYPGGAEEGGTNYSNVCGMTTKNTSASCGTP